MNMSIGFIKERKVLYYSDCIWTRIVQTLIELIPLLLAIIILFELYTQERDFIWSLLNVEYTSTQQNSSCSHCAVTGQWRCGDYPLIY